MSKIYTLQFGTGNPTGFSGLAPTMLIFYNLATGTTNAPPSISESPTGWGIYSFTYGTTQPIWFLADAATTSPGTAGRYVVGQIDPSDRADEYGNTTVALGNTAVATITNVGTTLVAIGNTSIAYGGTINAIITNSGVTLSGIGNTLIANGTTLVAIGNTSIAYGGTILQDIINIGITLVAIGNTTSSIGISISVILAGIGSTASLIGNNTVDPVDLFGYAKRIAELIQGQETFTKGSGALTMSDRTGATLLNTRTIINNASLVIKS